MPRISRSKPPQHVARRFAAEDATKAERRSITGESTWWPSPTSSGIDVSESNALYFLPFFAGVNVIATDIASVSRKVYRRTPTGKILDTSSRIYDIVHTEPNPEVGSFRFFQSLVHYALIWGNGYAEIERSGDGRVLGLHLLDPWTIRPCRRDGRLIYEQSAGPAILPQNIIHIAGLSRDGIEGYSLVRIARDAIALGRAAEIFGGSFFGNGANAQAVLEHPGEMGEEGVMRLRKQIADEHGGPYNAHKPLILEEGMKWVSMTMPLEDAQFLATRKFQVIDICRLLRLPPSKLADYDNAIKANMEESNTDYVQTCLMGWLEALESEINRKLFSKIERQTWFFEHDMNSLLRGNMSARAEFYTKMFAVGAHSTNSILRSENLDPIGPEGDRRFRPLNMKALDDLTPDKPTLNEAKP